MVRGLAVLLFQGRAASPSLCRSLLGARAVAALLVPKATKKAPSYSPIALGNGRLRLP